MRVTDHKSSWGKALFIAIHMAFNLTFIFWLVWPYQPLIVHSMEVVNPDKIVYAGSDLLLKIRYTKIREFQVLQVQLQLVDGLVLTLAPDDIGHLPLGIDVEIIVPISIPPMIYTGTFRLHAMITYKVNPIRNIPVIGDSDNFNLYQPSTG